MSPMGPGFFIFFREDTGSYGASPELFEEEIFNIPDELGGFRDLWDEWFGEEETPKANAMEGEAREFPVSLPSIQRIIRKKPVKARQLLKKIGIKKPKEDSDMELLFWFLLLSEL